jgi:hypothetical protein
VCGMGRWKMRRVAPRRGERGFCDFHRAPTRGRERGERRGFCMGFVPASSRDRLTWTGNESRGMRAGSARKNQPHTRVLSVGQPRVRDPLLAGEILGSDTCLLTRRPTVKRSNVDSPNERLGSTIGSASDSSSEGCEFDSCLGQFLHTNYSYGTFVLYIS